MGLPASMVILVLDIFAHGHQGFARIGIGLAPGRDVVHGISGPLGVVCEGDEESWFWLELIAVKC